MSFSFGTPSSAPATNLGGGFTFGPNKPAAPSFGLPATTQAGTLFGSPASNAPPAFGSSPATAFGSTPTSSFGFGTNLGGFGTSVASSTPVTGLSFGGTTSIPSTGLNFSTPATSTATATLGGLGGFNFNTVTSAPATTTQTGGLGGFSGGLFGGATTTTSTAGAATTTTSLGLGGVDPSKSVIGNTATNTTTNAGHTEQQACNTKLPNEIMQTVQSFQEFVKQQKSLSSDVMRASIKPLHKVNTDIEALRREIVAADGSMRAARTQSRRLRAACAKTLAAAEAAQRTYETPPGLQYENASPPQYMLELAVELEQQLHSVKRQMEEAGRHMQAAPKLLSHQELQQGMRRMHESLVAVAGRLQSVHVQVEAQKEQYLALRRNVLKDPTDVFQQGPKAPKMGKLEQVLTNTHPTSAVLADPRLALAASRQISGPNPFGVDPALDTPFGLAALHSTALGSSWSQPTSAAINTNMGNSNLNTGNWGTMGTLGTPNTSFGGSGIGGIGSNTGALGMGASGARGTGFGTMGFNTSGTLAGNTLSTREAETFQLQKPPKKSRH